MAGPPSESNVPSAPPLDALPVDDGAPSNVDEDFRMNSPPPAAPTECATETELPMDVEKENDPVAGSQEPER